MNDVLARPKSNLEMRIEQRVQQATEKFVQNDDCWDGGAGQNDIFFITISSGPAGNAKGDIPIHLPKAYGRILLVSIASTGGFGSRQYMHLSALGKKYTGVSISDDGTENWFSFRGQGGNSGVANMLKFRRGIQDFFVDLDFAAGAVEYNFTLACFNEDFDITAQYLFVQ